MKLILHDRLELPFLRSAIVLGVLGFSIWFARSPAFILSRIVLLAIPGLIAAIILLKHPELGLLALIIASLVVPFEIGTGTQTTINAVILIIALLFFLWVFDQVALKRKFHLIRSRPLDLLFGLCLAVALAFTIGQLDWFAFGVHAPIRSQIGGLAIFFLSTVAFLLVTHQVSNLRWLEILVWLFLTLAAGFILSNVIPGISWISNFYNAGSTGSLFWVWVVSLSFSQALFNHNLKPVWRGVLFGIAIITLSTRFFFFRSWASGWLPPGIAVLTILLIGLPRLGMPLTVTAFIAGARYYQSFVASLNLAVFTRGDEYSYLTRTEAWQILREIIQRNPITGFGPANYYFYTLLIPIRGYYVTFNSHNQYIDIVAQTGVIGLAFFIWFFWEIGRLGWKLKDRVPDNFARAYVIGALGGLAGMLASGMLGDWVIPFVYNIGFKGFQASVLGWIFLGGLVALEHITKNSEQGTIS